MNFMPAKVEEMRSGWHRKLLTLDYAPKTTGAAKTELGIRPEFIGSVAKACRSPSAR